MQNDQSSSICALEMIIEYYTVNRGEADRERWFFKGRKLPWTWNDIKY